MYNQPSNYYLWIKLKGDKFLVWNFVFNFSKFLFYRFFKPFYCISFYCNKLYYIYIIKREKTKAKFKVLSHLKK